MRPLHLCILICTMVLGSLQGCRHLPRMDRQPSVKPYERPMPATPPHSVPRRTVQPVPGEQEARSLRNPVPPTGAALARGRLYYGYYCAMCHGPGGRGHAPVGESYHPAPTDLTDPELQSRSDGTLYRDMVVGTGHEPTLAHIVEPERRWLIVHHLRTFADHQDLALPEATRAQDN